MSEYKLRELEYVDGGFRARFTPVDNDIEFFIRNEEGVETLLHYASHPDELVWIDVDDDACTKESKIHFSRGCVGSKWYPCCWLKRLVDE
jgi:hypothetical protein